MVRLLVTSKRTSANNTHLPELLLPVPHPCIRPLLIHTSARDPQTLIGRSGLVFCGGHCSLPLGPDMHKILCVPSKSGASVTPSPVEFQQSNPAGLQGQILWGLSYCQIPKLGSLMWDSDLSLLWENSCGLIILQFVGYPPGMYVI